MMYAPSAMTATNRAPVAIVAAILISAWTLSAPRGLRQSPSRRAVGGGDGASVGSQSETTTKTQAVPRTKIAVHGGPRSRPQPPRPAGDLHRVALRAADHPLVAGVAV